MTEQAEAESVSGDGFRRIVWPTDFSETAESALAHAAELATRFDAELEALHLRPEGEMQDSGRDGPDPEIEERIRTRLAKLPSGLKFRISVVRSEIPAEAIEKHVRSSGIDLVVMGHREQSRLARCLKGSVTEYILNSSPCPVLVVTSGRTDYRSRPRYRNMLVGLDFSENAREAARETVRLAQRYEAHVFFVHVVEKRVNPALLDSWNRFLQKEMTTIAEWANAALRDTLGEELPEGEVVIRYSDTRPDQEIRRYADSQKVDLIVVGRHGTSAIERFLMGSTSNRLFQGSPCPVLTFPPSVEQKD